MLLPWQSCPHNPSQGVTDESISQVITDDMALPISHCLGAEVPVPSTEGEGFRGGPDVHKDILGATGLRGGGVERAG